MMDYTQIISITLLNLVFFYWGTYIGFKFNPSKEHNKWLENLLNEEIKERYEAQSKVRRLENEAKSSNQIAFWKMYAKLMSENNIQKETK